ncbi:BTB-domain-containing protein [Rhizophagus irregularis]|nr:BTB-domain-containing protein [Rhizophagus irregularis]
MSFKLLTIFSNDIINLLNNSEEFNVAIYVGEGDNQKVFQAHSLILRARSSYFHTALSKQWVRKEGDDNILRQPNISPQVFEIILNYIYSGTISLIDRDIMEILEILAASDELLLNDLLDFIQEYLIETKNEWLHSSILKIYQTSLAHGSCEKLRKFILATISSDPELLFKSANFLSLDVSLLTPILKRDDLDMAEDEVWEQVIRWGLAQHLSFSANIRDWGTEQFQALSSTLQECIFLVRFFQMSSSDLYDKVWPFRAILPPELEDDIVRCHLKPGSKPTFGVNTPRGNSTLVGHQQMSRIADWIDRKDSPTYTGVDLPYKFKLLVRGTRDGFDSQTFHAKCDEQGPTFVIMKIAVSGEVIGGYNPIKWQIGTGHLETRDSFLFSFGNRGCLEDAKISRVLRANYAIPLKDESYGPCFGDKDLSMQGNFSHTDSCSCKEDDYEAPIVKHRKFSAVEYEVFKVIKK